LIAARSDAGIIQAEVAAPMATITSVVSRLESGLTRFQRSARLRNMPSPWAVAWRSG
jgi:predicted transcriptional regulator